MSQADKLRATNIAKYGSEEAWKAHLRAIAAKGGAKTTGKTGFALMTKKKHKEASSKGGKRKHGT